jgi:hypothetical protein
MPYVYDPLLDDEENQGQGAPQAPMTGGGETFSGESAGGGLSQAPQQKGVNRQGSGFVGLDQYLAANKGSQFGKQVTGKVADTLGSAKQQLGQSAQDFTNASNQGTTRWNDVDDEFKGIVDSAGKDTTAEQTARAKELERAKYKGPDSFYGTAGSNQAMGGIEKAKQQSQALQSEGGRFALLDQYFGRPTYSLGQKTLDNALVNGTPGVAARSVSLGNRANQLSDEARQTGLGLENLATANKEATADTAKNASEYATGALDTFGTGLNQRYADFSKGNDEYNQTMRGMLSNLSPESAASNGADPYELLGLTGNENLYGLKDFSPYVQDSAKPTLSQFASPEDAARYRALGEIASDNFQMPIDATQAGTAGTGRITADKGRVNQAIGERHKAADTQSNNILQQGINILNNDPEVMSKSPEDRTLATMNRLEPLLDEFAKTYGFRPQITPEMLWGQSVDYNNTPTDGGLVNSPVERRI